MTTPGDVVSATGAYVALIWDRWQTDLARTMDIDGSDDNQIKELIWYFSLSRAMPSARIVRQHVTGTSNRPRRSSSWASRHGDSAPAPAGAATCPTAGAARPRGSRSPPRCFWCVEPARPLVFPRYQRGRGPASRLNANRAGAKMTDSAGRPHHRAAPDHLHLPGVRRQPDRRQPVARPAPRRHGVRRGGLPGRHPAAAARLV
jgi:hypothetical protein